MTQIANIELNDEKYELLKEKMIKEYPEVI